MSDINMGILQGVDELNAAAKISYVPFMTILSNRQDYEEKIDSQNFLTLKGNEEEMLSQMERARIDSTTTEIEHVKAEKSKVTFNKYFYLTQYNENSLDKYTAMNEIADKGIRVGSIRMDRDTWNGANGNGGFYNSPNNSLYVTNTAATIAATEEFSKWNELFADLKDQANQMTSSQRIYFALYGKIAKTLNGRTFQQSGDSFLSKLKANNSECRFVEVPQLVESVNSGILVISDDFVKLHYTAMPRTYGTGRNDEKHYNWVQTITGSAMVELKEKGAIIKQDVTISV